MKLLKRGTIGLLLFIIVIYGVLVAYLKLSEAFIAQESKFNASQLVRLYSKHSILPLIHPLQSLKARLDLIKEAKKTLELEFFIYELDEASQILTQALEEASLRGVKVRILVDFSVAVFKLAPKFLSRLTRRGVQVRYYNTVSNFRFISAQHRSHRKLLIADGKKVITGGRNIANEYFGLSPSYNFLDTDIQIEGEIVKSVQKSFDQYWNSSLASTPSADFEASDDKLFSTRPETKKRILNKIQKSDSTSPSFICHDLTFVTDSPGVLLNNRKVYSALVEVLKETKSEIYGESPYFVLRNDGLNQIKKLSNRSVRQVYLTNSLASTDAYYTVAAMIPTLGSLTVDQLTLYAYTGRTSSNSEAWGLHSKRAVIDQKHTLVGTYNVDPRSANLNSELMFICRNNEQLAIFMKKDIEKRINLSGAIIKDQKTYTRRIIENASSLKILKTVLSLPLSRMLDFLL